MWGTFAKAVMTGKHRLAVGSWVAVVFTVIYTIWPFDLIPELPFGPIGLIDDLGLWGVLAAVLRWERGRFERGAAAEAVTLVGRATRNPR